MNEITLTTLDHLVLCAKRIKEVHDDFAAMLVDGIPVCSLAGECMNGEPSIHVLLALLFPLSTLANQKIAFEPLGDEEAHAIGSFIYSSVKFYAIFKVEEVEAYHAKKS